MDNNPIKTLIATHRLRLFAKQNHIQQIDANENAITLSFADNNSVDPVKIIALLQSNRNLKLLGQNKIKITVQSHGLVEKVKNIQEWVEKFQAA